MTAENKINFFPNVALTLRANNVNNLNQRQIDDKIKNINNRITENKKQLLTANKELLSATNEEIDIIRQLIAAKEQQAVNNEKRIDTSKKLIEVKQQAVGNLKNQIENIKDQVSVLQQSKVDIQSLITLHKEQKADIEKIIAAKQRLVGTHKEQRGLLQESRDLNQKMINVTEKMINIMMKNPAKYGDLSNSEVQKQPEVIEAKTQITQLVNSKVEQYPQKERAMLTDTVKSVVDATFLEIKPAVTDIKVGRELFYNLPKRIEVALDKKHEALFMKDIKQIMSDHYKSVEKFSRIKKLDYLDLALKDIKA